MEALGLLEMLNPTCSHTGRTRTHIESTCTQTHARTYTRVKIRALINRSFFKNENEAKLVKLSVCEATFVIFKPLF